MLSRMAQTTLRIFSCRFPANLDPSKVRTVRGARELRVDSNDSYCRELNSHSSQAALAWPHWCTLLTNVAHDCERRAGEGGSGSRSCLPSRMRALANAILCLRGAARLRQATKDPRQDHRKDQIIKAAAHEFGQKLYGNLQKGSKRKFMRGAQSVDALYELLARGCVGRFCSPKEAMLAGISELVGSRRLTRQAEEKPGERHSPGTVRAMTHGWATPLHMDSKHSSAWAAAQGAVRRDCPALNGYVAHRSITL